jgi:hypothetical protein
LAVPPAVARQREVVARVRSLFDELLLRAEVLDRVRTDPTLGEADRQFALGVAQTQSEDGAALNEAAWKVVKARDASQNAYAQALHRAEAAVRLAPGNWLNLTTRGVAQYRMGQNAEAVATLTQSDKLHVAVYKGSQPADLAFLAMAQHQLGQKEQAQATLGRLREVMKQPDWAQNAEAQGFLREAESLLQGKP